MSKVLVTGLPLSADHVRRLEADGLVVTNGTEECKRQLGLSGDELAGDLSLEQTRELISDVEIYIFGGYEALGAEALSAARELKLVTFLGTGWDDPGCVDSEAAREAGVTVTNTPHANAASVAELAMGLMIIQSRDEFWLNKTAKAGEWIQRITNDVSGRTLGIVGMGHIGSAIARHASRGFGMRISYAGPHRKPDAERELDAQFLPMNELLRTSDIVSINSPASSTQGLIDAAALSQMQSHAILINLSAPGIVDGEALWSALTSGSIRSAAMDGKYDDDLHQRLRGLDDDRFIIVPRTAWLTTDSYRRMGDMSLESIHDYLANRFPVRYQRLPIVDEPGGIHGNRQTE